MLSFIELCIVIFFAPRRIDILCVKLKITEYSAFYATTLLTQRFHAFLLTSVWKALTHDHIIPLRVVTGLTRVITMLVTGLTSVIVMLVTGLTSVIVMLVTGLTSVIVMLVTGITSVIAMLVTGLTSVIAMLLYMKSQVHPN
jgi:hypothetical protein